MRSRTLVSVFSAAAWFAVGSSARADMSSSKVTAEKSHERGGGDGDWSLGGGITLGGVALTNLGPMFFASSPQQGLSLVFERRLSRTLWLVARGQGWFQHSNTSVTTLPTTEPTPVLVAVPADGSWTTLSGGLGLRYAFVTDGPVDVSAYVIAGGSKQRYSATDVSFDGIGLDATFGLAVERELVEDLSLRVSTDLLRGGWSKLDARTPSQIVRSDAAYAVASIAPAIELRMRF